MFIERKSDQNFPVSKRPDLFTPSLSKLLWFDWRVQADFSQQNRHTFSGKRTLRNVRIL